MLSCVLALLACSCSAYDVGAIYFGNWHPDPWNEKEHGAGWTEWGLVTGAQPRYPGEFQPNIPYSAPGWGVNYSEADPKNMAIKIDTAAANGIDFFLFDWYWYKETMGGPPFLSGALEQGFLQAPNKNKLKFALMWASQDWADIHPAKRQWASTYRQSDTPDPHMLLLFDGFVSADVTKAAADYVVSKYFTQSNYYRVPTKLPNGTLAQCCLFSVYQMEYLIIGAGGLSNLADAFNYFRQKALQAGTCLHLNMMGANYQNPANIPVLGIDSATDYGWMKTVAGTSFPEMPYADVVKGGMAAWDALEEKYDGLGIPYIPSISSAWDSSPRTLPTDPYGPWGYPWGSSFHSTPAQFQDALAQAKTHLAARCARPQTWCPPLLINAWNEWSEGAYLEPDVQYGFSKLNAVGKVFGNSTE